MTKTPKFCRNRLVLAFSVCASLATSALSSPESTEVVGEVTTLIGHGVVRQLNTDPKPLERGYRVRAGDKIETTAGGHVHIRFVDGGLVSVRPSSRLQIAAYTNGNNQNPAAIKFQLEEGVIRSVTGQWGEANRDRFRLNTPIAAIGVKGTDFVVKVENGSTYATVLSGAIVMAPLTGSCAQSLGPCNTPSATLLNADMQGQMLEYLRKNDVNGPRLVPQIDLLARIPSNQGIGNETRRADIGLAETHDKGAKIEIAAKETLNSDNAKPPPPITPTSLPMVWLHSAFDANTSENTISQRFDEATRAGRTLAAGNFRVSLYRDETQLKTYQPNGTQASFNLTQSSASFRATQNYNYAPETVNVTSGTLNTDFTNGRFTTQINMNAPTMGQAQFNAQGNIKGQGLLVADYVQGNNMSGALSLDGQQAGYAFEKALPNGKVSGLTLWGR